jgi:hypothetical protein
MGRSSALRLTQTRTATLTVNALILVCSSPGGERMGAAGQAIRGSTSAIGPDPCEQRTDASRMPAARRSWQTAFAGAPHVMQNITVLVARIPRPAG